MCSWKLEQFRHPLLFPTKSCSLIEMPSPAVCKACLIDAHGRRLRYPLASSLMRGVLAKAAGQESRRGIAHWAKLRKQELQLLFTLKRETMPH